MKVQMRRLTETAKLPTRGSVEAAGYDLYADGIEMLILRGDTKLVHTGISVAIPNGYVGYIFARSGLATKRGLRPANCVGVIDSDYRGEVMVALHNDGQDYQPINPGERIAQLVIAPYLSFDIEEVDELDSTERGEGGFGSTGV